MSDEGITMPRYGPLATPRARTAAIPVAGGMVLSAGGVSTDGVTPINSTGILAAPSLTFTIDDVANRTADL
jgi:hypothetical protein